MKSTLRTDRSLLRPVPPSLSEGKAYHAFISYKRNPDEPIAKELQQSLHHLARPWFRWRALRVFRDVTSLPAGGNLTKDIQRRLDESEFLILLASPEAFAPLESGPSWVQQEVE